MSYTARGPQNTSAHQDKKGRISSKPSIGQGEIGYQIFFPRKSKRNYARESHEVALVLLIYYIYRLIYSIIIYLLIYYIIKYSEWKKGY